MNQDTDLGDIKIDLGIQKAYEGMGESATPQPNIASPGQQEQMAQKPQPTGLFACCTIEFYQPFFDVTTDDVKERIIATLDPRKNNFFEIIQDRPDLYGPFWIYTTLIFTLAAAGNFSSYLAALFYSNHPDEEFKAKFSYVPTACGVIYGFGLAIPIIFTLLLKFFGSKVTAVNCLCIYGYATFVLIPVLIIAIIPNSILQWIVLVYGAASTAWFLLNNYAHEMKKYVGKQRYILLGFIGGSQFVLLLVFKLVFFNKIFGSETETEA